MEKNDSNRIVSVTEVDLLVWANETIDEGGDFTFNVGKMRVEGPVAIEREGFSTIWVDYVILEVNEDGDINEVERGDEIEGLD